MISGHFRVQRSNEVAVSVEDKGTARTCVMQRCESVAESSENQGLQVLYAERGRNVLLIMDLNLDDDLGLTP